MSPLKLKKAPRGSFMPTSRFDKSPTKDLVSGKLISSMSIEADQFFNSYKNSNMNKRKVGSLLMKILRVNLK